MDPQNRKNFLKDHYKIALVAGVAFGAGSSIFGRPLVQSIAIGVSSAAVYLFSMALTQK